jgi:hypothetical protein
MKKCVKKHSLLYKIGVKGREKDRSRPLKDKKEDFKFGPSFKGHIQKKVRRNTHMASEVYEQLATPQRPLSAVHAPRHK